MLRLDAASIALRVRVQSNAYSAGRFLIEYSCSSASSGILISLGSLITLLMLVRRANLLRDLPNTPVTLVLWNVLIGLLVYFREDYSLIIAYLDS
jgi:uncharacterized protein (TIGR03382 family)